MKKLIYLFVAVVFATQAFAQNFDAIKKSKERMEKLFSLEVPKPCSLLKVDSLTSESEKIVQSLKANSLLLYKYYYSLNGKTELGEDYTEGIIPTLTELTTLSEAIKEEPEAIKKVSKLLPEATKEMKTIKNPMKLKAINKSLKYSQEVITLAAEEHTAQLELIIELVKQVTK